MSELDLLIERGACSNADPEMFFETKGGQPTAAKRICARCEVRDECLDHALRSDLHGIWGGTTRSQRTRIANARGIVREESFA